MADTENKDAEAEEKDSQEAEKDDFAEKQKQAKEEMENFQEQDELPSDLKEWPGGKAKYTTFDSESGEAYGEGLTEKIGPPVTYHEDGSVTVDGKKVDNPEDYKGDPIELATTDNPDSEDVSEDDGEEQDAQHSKGD
jgi:hypothetical protein